MHLESAASNSRASSSPTLANSHEPNDVATSCSPAERYDCWPSHDHGSFYHPCAVNAAGPNFAQSAAAMRPDARDNRMTNRHQRLSAAHPYTIPRFLPNHVDGSATRECADGQNQSLPPNGRSWKSPFDGSKLAPNTGHIRMAVRSHVP